MEQHKNIFAGGLDRDTTYANVDQQNYIDAVNVSLVGDNKYTVLQNIKGTTKVSDITAFANTNILAVFPSTYQIGSTQDVNCVTVFTATSGGTFNIYCYDTDHGVLYSLYQETAPGDYFTSDRVIDGISYAERGFDVLFFTDFYNEIRKFRCVIPASYTPNFLQKTEIGLTMRRAIGTITLGAIPTTGALLTGTYQLAYQLLNPSNGKYTNFSLLTTPIHVYTTINGNVFAGVGLPSSKAIQVNITPTADELSNYTHFRLAVVENINPEGVFTAEVGMTKIETIATYLSGGVITNYLIKDNVQLNTTTIDDITVDLAAIQKVKTLAIANNRLIAGNVTYRNLTYDNGTPAITSGTLLVQTGTADSFSSDLFTSRYKGHFRDEVYRYAISYFDEFGNFSYPSTIDMTSVSGNMISGAIDMRYPARHQYGGNASVMDASNNTKSLGVTLTGVTNHPTWARGFIILRAKRKKDVLFQTPAIPLVRHLGLEAVQKYPTVTTEGTGAGTAVSYTGATPMGPSEVFFPMNLFMGRRLQMSRITTNSGSGLNAFYAGEVAWADSTVVSNYMLFPDSTMYSTQSKYSFTNAEQIHSVDAAICRLYFTRFDSNTSINCGSTINTSCSGSFFASLDGDYYFNHGNAKSMITGGIVTGGDNSISANKLFDNYSSGGTLNGSPVFDPSKLTTGGITLGFSPNTQRSVAVKALNSQSIPGGLTFTNGTPSSTTVTSGFAASNDFITSTTGLYGGYVNTIEIVNVLAGLTDKRYGQSQDYNEFIFTGTQVVFSPSEVVTVAAGGALPKTVDVWGGDCIVSPHCFKIADSTYSVINQEKASGSGQTGTVSIPKYTKIWLDNSGGSVLMAPVALKNAAQYLTLVLESEYHGSVRDIDTSEYVGTYNFPIRGAATEPTARACMTYNNNVNLNKQNDQKIFVPIDPTQPVVTQFRSRVVYSNLKVYQTNIEGFNAFPVGNTYDLPEKYGKLTGVRVGTDAFYAFQTDAIAYIPVAEKVLELSNAAQLGVRTGDIFGRYIYLTTKGGSQHLKSIVRTGQAIFAFDNQNKSIYFINGAELKDITPGIQSPMRTSFANTTIPENQINGFYDQIRNEYWIANNDGSFCLVFNEQIGKWTSNYMLGAGFNGAVVMPNQIYAVGKNGSNFSLETFYTGNPCQFFGTYSPTAYVDFVINPVPDQGKTFDNMLITASDRLSTLDITVERDTTLANQAASGMILDITSRGEGTYRIKTLRDGNGARLRGIYGKARINWKTGLGSQQVSLFSAVTSYRPSF